MTFHLSVCTVQALSIPPWSRWVTSRCALLDVTARHFRLFAHKSLYVWLPLCQPPITRYYLHNTHLHTLLWRLDMLICVDTPAAHGRNGRYCQRPNENCVFKILVWDTMQGRFLTSFSGLTANLGMFFFFFLASFISYLFMPPTRAWH